MAGQTRTFAALNIKCGGCANTVKKNLREQFGEVEVNLDVEPRTLTLEVDDDFDEDAFRAKMLKMGYPLVDEELGAIESAGAKAKSFVSCAIGRMDMDGDEK